MEKCSLLSPKYKAVPFHDHVRPCKHVASAFPEFLEGSVHRRNPQVEASSAPGLTCLNSVTVPHAHQHKPREYRVGKRGSERAGARLSVPSVPLGIEIISVVKLPWKLARVSSLLSSGNCRKEHQLPAKAHALPLLKKFKSKCHFIDVPSNRAGQKWLLLPLERTLLLHANVLGRCFNSQAERSDGHC